jgi:hypothetical protein
VNGIVVIIKQWVILNYLSFSSKHHRYKEAVLRGVKQIADHVGIVYDWTSGHNHMASVPTFTL